MARSRVTFTSTLVMNPRSAPSDSTEWSGELPPSNSRWRKLTAPAATSPSTRLSPLSTSSNRSPRIAEADPKRAVGLYETFIAACYEKADEVDDSSGYLGMFGGSLSARWVTARQAVFIREFEKVVTGVTPEPEPSFLEKARARWAPPE